MSDETLKTNSKFLGTFAGNFELLVKAAREGALAMVHCRTISGGDAAVLCAVEKDGEDYVFHPLADMLTEEELVEILPPTTDKQG